MRRFLFTLLVVCALALPALSYAATVRDFKGLICLLVGFINPIIILLTGVAILAFLWGVTRYIYYAGNETKKQEGRDTMVYGLIGLFVFFSFWGIIRIVQNTFFEDVPGHATTSVCGSGGSGAGTSI